MKRIVLTGSASLIGAVAALGRPVLAGLGVLALIVVGAGCWVLANRSRTRNAVAIINAARRTPADAAAPLLPAARGHRNRRPRRRAQLRHDRGH